MQMNNIDPIYPQSGCPAGHFHMRHINQRKGIMVASGKNQAFASRESRILRARLDELVDGKTIANQDEAA